MKKMIAAAVLAAMPFTAAQADPDAGCGLGSMIFAGKTGLTFKVLAATTNGSSGNQTFGMSFGTLGCDGKGTVTSREKISMFIDNNLDNLARDMSRGEGESLDTLAALWGMDSAEKAQLSTLAKNNFGQVFSSESVTAQDVVNNLNALMADDQALSQYTLS